MWAPHEGQSCGDGCVKSLCGRKYMSWCGWSSIGPERILALREVIGFKPYIPEWFGGLTAAVHETDEQAEQWRSHIR